MSTDREKIRQILDTHYVGPAELVRDMTDALSEHSHQVRREAWAAATGRVECQWSLVFGDPKAYWQTGCGKQAWFSEHRHPKNENFCCYCGGCLAMTVIPVMSSNKRASIAALESAKERDEHNNPMGSQERN